MITSEEREFAVGQLDQTRDRMLALLRGLSPDQLQFKPASGCWSVAENVEHVLIVEKRLVGAMEKMMEEPADLSRQPAIDDAEVIRVVGTVQEPLQAPPNVSPTLRWPAQELVQQFETIRQRTRDFAASTEGDLRHHFIPHGRFGDLDFYQWLLLIGAHCNRHSLQSEAVTSSPGFPR